MFYWHDMEPSKGQPQKLVEQQREIYERDQQIPLTKTLESCNKKTIRVEMNSSQPP